MQSGQDSLETLMRAARRGDGAAYRRFLERAAAAVRARIAPALTRAGRGNAEVEDIVQETLLAIHLKRDSWSEDRPLAPWLAAIARYKLVDALRRRGLSGAAPLDDVIETVAAPAPEPHVEGDVRKLLDRLPERARRIVTAISIEGRSAAEAGREVGISEGAARVALHRALKELGRLYRSSLDAH